MGFFDRLLGRKSSLPAFEPTNRLEHLLAEAAQKPEKRPEFFRQIFHYDLFVIGKLEEKPDGRKVVLLMKGGTDQDPVAYVYTSAEALSWQLRKTNQGPQPYLKMKTQDLLGLILGQQGFVLNWGHPHGLHLPTAEVQNIFATPHTTETIAKAETVNIGKPAELPPDFLKVLSAYKNANRTLQDIRFGMIQRDGGQPEYLYVLSFKDSAGPGEKERLKGDIYRLTKDAYGRELPVNFLDLAELGDTGQWTQNDVLYAI